MTAAKRTATIAKLFIFLKFKKLFLFTKKLGDFWFNTDRWAYRNKTDFDCAKNNQFIVQIKSLPVKCILVSSMKKF